MIISPWEAAGRLFNDRADIAWPDHRVEALSRWRGLLGIALTLWLTLGYRSMWRMVNDALEALLLLVMVTVVVVVVGIAVLYVATPPAHRPDLRRGIASPARTIALALLTVVGPVVLYLGVRDSVRGLGLLVMVAAMLWWVVFAARSLWFVAASVLSVGTVHPMLAPICATTALAVKAVVEVVLGQDGGLPLGLWLLLTACGLLSVAAVSAYEYALLHRSGVRLVPGP